MSSLMLLGTSRLNWFPYAKRNSHVDAIQEEDLQDLLAQCEGDDTLRPMPVVSSEDESGGLPWFINCILRIINVCCCR